jgi:hypothetical protein
MVVVGRCQKNVREPRPTILERETPSRRIKLATEDVVCLIIMTDNVLFYMKVSNSYVVVGRFLLILLHSIMIHYIILDDDYTVVQL